MYYIRFTNDIQADIKRGKSPDFRTKKALPGLCAWKINSDLGPDATDEEICEAAAKTAGEISRNSYCGYSSKSQYAVLVGTYVGGSNDGSCIKVDRVVSIESL